MKIKNNGVTMKPEENRIVMGAVKWAIENVCNMAANAVRAITFTERRGSTVALCVVHDDNTGEEMQVDVKRNVWAMRYNNNGNMTAWSEPMRLESFEPLFR